MDHIFQKWGWNKFFFRETKPEGECSRCALQEILRKCLQAKDYESTEKPGSRRERVTLKMVWKKRWILKALQDNWLSRAETVAMHCGILNICKVKQDNNTKVGGGWKPTAAKSRHYQRGNTLLGGGFGYIIDIINSKSINLKRCIANGPKAEVKWNN